MYESPTRPSDLVRDELPDVHLGAVGGPVPPTEEEVFGMPEDLWRRVLRRMGGTPGRWSTWTDNPVLN